MFLRVGGRVGGCLETATAVAPFGLSDAPWKWRGGGFDHGTVSCCTFISRGAASEFRAYLCDAINVYGDGWKKSRRLWCVVVDKHGTAES